jgi:hypothetical protein
VALGSRSPTQADKRDPLKLLSKRLGLAIDGVHQFVLRGAYVLFDGVTALPPKAKVVSSNLAGSAINIKDLAFSTSLSRAGKHWGSGAHDFASVRFCGPAAAQRDGRRYGGAAAARPEERGGAQEASGTRPDGDAELGLAFSPRETEPWPRRWRAARFAVLCHVGTDRPVAAKC